MTKPLSSERAPTKRGQGRRGALQDGDDSFRNYMTRKIEMQRHQFGLTVPPNPELVHAEEDRIFLDSTEQDNESVIKGSHKNMDGLVNRLKRKYECDSSPDGQFQSSSNQSELDEIHRGRPDLFFKGIVCLINGYTNPDSDGLMRLLHKHGGDLEKYETSRVTHIIATSMSVAKAKIYGQRRRPVIRPEWITESVKLSRLLPPGDFFLECVRDEAASPIKNFFADAMKKNVERKVEGRSIEEIQYESSNTLFSAESCHGNKCCTDGGRVKPNHLFDNCNGRAQKKWKSPREATKANLEVEKNLSHCDRALVAASKMSTMWHRTKCADAEQHSNNNSFHYTNAENDVASLEALISHASSKPRDSASYNPIDTSEPIAKKESPITSGFVTEQNSPCEALPTKHCTIVRSSKEAEAKELVCNQIDALAGGSLTGVSPSRDDEVATHSNSKWEKLEKKLLRSSNSSRLPSGAVRTVGTDPNYLESFFSSSRLSFIGSFKQRNVIDQCLGDTLQSAESVSDTKDVLYFHVDMDSFFASVALRKFPQHKQRPVAVGHGWKDSLEFVSSNRNVYSTSELSTCNYEARKFGVKKGMFLGEARKLCPALVVLPYDYASYEIVSSQVNKILSTYAENHFGTVEQVSCDEFFVRMCFEVTDRPSEKEKIAHVLAEEVRLAIVDTTECTASIGVGRNKFLARLATNVAKPNRCFVADDWKTLLKDLCLGDLPGVGSVFRRKLESFGLLTVQDIWSLSASAIDKVTQILGPKNGRKLIDHCHGLDSRPDSAVPRKTISVLCNYGVRFDGPYGPDYMIDGLAREVESRMKAVGVLGSRITLKVKQRMEDAPMEPAKFNGCGRCYNLSRSCDMGDTPIRDSIIFAAHCMQLFKSIGLKTLDVRGMGIVVSGLRDESFEPQQLPGMDTWLSKISEYSTYKEERHCSSRAMPTGKPGRFCLNEHSSIFKNVDEVNNLKRLNETSKISDYNEDSGIDRACDNLNFSGTPQQDELCSVLGTDKVQRGEVNASSAQKSEAGKGGVELDLPKADSAETPKPRKQASRFVHPAPPTLLHKRDKTTAESFDDERKRFRQVSVKRMLKLAAVKSGEDKLTDTFGGDPVSLTQLRFLPLGMQLTVANGLRSTTKNCPKCIDRTHHEKTPVLERGEDCASSFFSDDEGLEVKYARYNSEKYAGCNFYHENVLPLEKWMDLNPYPEFETAEQMKLFLSFCVTEKRLDDAVVFLRIIKCRSDAWGNKWFVPILDWFAEFLLEKDNRKLDLKWLGLT